MTSSGQVAVWTLIIKGGEAFSLKIRDQLGPRLDHDGVMTIWKMVGTRDEARSIETWITGPLIGSRVQLITETEDDEMLAIRHDRLGRGA